MVGFIIKHEDIPNPKISEKNIRETTVGEKNLAKQKNPGKLGSISTAI